MNLSTAQREVVTDLLTNGPLYLNYWTRSPQRNGVHIFYRRSRVTSRTFESLEKKGLLEWYARRDEDGYAVRYWKVTEKARKVVDTQS